MNLTRVCGGHKNMCSIDCISTTECFDNVCGGRMNMMCCVFVDLNSEIDHEVFDLSDRKTYSGTLSNQNSWRGESIHGLSKYMGSNRLLSTGHVCHHTNDIRSRKN